MSCTVMMYVPLCRPTADPAFGCQMISPILKKPRIEALDFAQAAFESLSLNWAKCELPPARACPFRYMRALLANSLNPVFTRLP